MARKRQVDPDYPFEAEIALLSVPARYFYILSWCYMDDANGVLPHNPHTLKLCIFPEDDIDVGAIIDELIRARRLFPFEAQGKKWLWCPTLLKHQIISHPTKKCYPPPPPELREAYRNGTAGLRSTPEYSGGLHQSRESRESRESRVKNTASPPDGVSLKLKDLLKEVSKDINIYSLINRLKKDLHWAPGAQFPEPVLIGVCEQYLKDKGNIKSEWPWFVKVIKIESGKHYANQSVARGDALKNEPVAISIKEIMEKASQGGPNA